MAAGLHVDGEAREHEQLAAMAPPGKIPSVAPPKETATAERTWPGVAMSTVAVQVAPRVGTEVDA
jgi:hypothetical protein